MQKEKQKYTLHPKLQHPVLGYLLPDAGTQAVFADRSVRQQYYQYPACPQYIILRETYSLPAPYFLAYIFEAHGRELSVVACWERSSSGIQHFAAGYPYIVLPDEGQDTLQWEYRMSDEIHVDCRSQICDPDHGKNILKVERRMHYAGHPGSMETCLYEYYREGSGILRIGSTA